MATHAEGAPRRLKRIKPPAGTDEVPKDETKTFEFYKRIIHISILRLKNEKEKLNYSSWLTRLDREQPNQSRKFLVVALFVSLKSHRPFCIFSETPPDDLSELNTIQYDNMMEFVKKQQQETNTFFTNEDVPIQVNAERLAAVATDMCSYSATKTSQYMAQSFYARSDFPINTWYNEKSILLPNNLDHNEWELYLNRLYTVEKSQDTGGPKSQHECEIMKIDQVTKNISYSFSWHPLSVLYNNDIRPQKTACFLDVDQDILNQPFNQRQIDEAAMAIVHEKSFPGYKMLNPRCYSPALMPDPKFVYNTTGVKIIHSNKMLSLVDKHADRTPKTCPLARRPCSSGSGCAMGTPANSASGNAGQRRQPPPGSTETSQNREHPETSPCAKYAVRACPAKAETVSIDRGRKYGCCDRSIYDTEPGSREPEPKPGNGRCRYNRSDNQQVDLNNNNNNNDNNERPAMRNECCKMPFNNTSNSDRNASSSNKVSSDRKREPDCNGARKNVTRSPNGQCDADSKYDDFSPVGPLCKMKQRDEQPCACAVRNPSGRGEENDVSQCSGRRRDKQEQRPCRRVSNSSRSARSNKDRSAVGTANRSARNGACRVSGPRQRSVSVPGGYGGTRNGYNDRTGGTQTRAKQMGENGNKSSCGLDANEQLNAPRFNETWDPDVNDYSEFASHRNGEQNGFFVSERKPGPVNGQTGDESADDGSRGSDWSVEVDVPPGSDDYYDSLESLSMLTSNSGGFRDEDSCPDHGPDAPESRDRSASAANGINGWYAGKSSLDENNNYASPRVPRSFNDGHRTGSNGDDWSRAEEMQNAGGGCAADVSDNWANSDSAGYAGGNESDLRNMPNFHDYPLITDTSLPDCSYESSDDDASIEECPHGTDNGHSRV